MAESEYERYMLYKNRTYEAKKIKPSQIRLHGDFVRNGDHSATVHISFIDDSCSVRRPYPDLDSFILAMREMLPELLEKSNSIMDKNKRNMHSALKKSLQYTLDNLEGDDV